MKRALITGVTGQDGSYMAELLLEKGYEVHGMIRRSSMPNTGRIEKIKEKIKLHYGDMTDGDSVLDTVRKSVPDEIYHLAAQTHVGLSFNQPQYTMDVNALGTLKLLDAVRRSGVECRIYNASSSEMFGNAPTGYWGMQSIDTAFMPVSPYGVSKVAAHAMCTCYRESYGMWVVNGILLNHESERRGIEFMSRKVTKAVAEIKKGKRTELRMGNPGASRDMGYAPEFVRMMWLMVQQEEPKDYVIATGHTISVLNFVKTAFKYAMLNYEDYVIWNCGEFMRPNELHNLCGDSNPAKKELGWVPEVYGEELAHLMVNKAMEEES